MRSLTFRVATIAMTLLGGIAELPRLAAEVRPDRPVDFNRDVRPILSDACFRCHGPDAEHRETELRFDVEESAKGDLGGYHAIVPGEPEQSELLRRIVSTEADERMPPPDTSKQLSVEQIEVLRRWIDQGAPWSQHWAYLRPKRHPAPAATQAEWPLNWVDRFILHRLEVEQLDPSPEADRVTLIRRLYFDLTGLPPAPEDVDRFIADSAPNAYERIVDRLLASERYGERMAMYWLDLVRYADTVGYHGDQDHNVSPYRDYVIDAMNTNMPFDRFTLEQLAGDLLPEATIDQKVATGYNRLLQTSHEGGVQEKEYLAIYAADRVRNVSAVWMGATVGCAQCHDHKYDPYTMRDFYSLAAFFADVDEAQHFKKGTNSLPTARPPEITVLNRRERAQLAKYEQRVAELEKRLSQLPPSQSRQADALRRQITANRAQIDMMRNHARKCMVTVSIAPRVVRVLPRGDWLDESGPIVDPAVPEFLDPLDDRDRRLTREDLANWLTDPDDGIGGLTARVQVNRLWYLMFGVGIAGVLDDFGGQGEAPAFPELLDTLAVEFVESGWDFKHMVRLLVTSRAYRQSSMAPPALLARDPDNRLFARQSRFRLPAEMVRDNALAISGLLVSEYGGASVKPYQPAGYYRHLNFPTRTYQHDIDRRQWRRGVYIHWQRQFLHPMLRALDAPQREECTARRPRSNTPVAALTLLNDPSFVEAARVFAERIVRQGGQSDRARLQFAFRCATSRLPDAFEYEMLQKLLDSSKDHYAAAPQHAKQLAQSGLAPVPADIVASELAAWTTVARAILNLSETMTRY
jgi:hypothetical protein